EVAPADIDIAYRRRVRAVIDGDPGLVLLDVRCPVGIRRDRIGRARGEVDGREAGDADVEAVTVVDYIEVQIREIDVARFIDGDGRVAVGEPQIAVARYEKPEERVQRDIVLGPRPAIVRGYRILGRVEAAEGKIAHGRHERVGVVRVDRDVLFRFQNRGRWRHGRKDGVGRAIKSCGRADADGL